jgi:small subunit ribosomal protein S6e
MANFKFVVSESDTKKSYQFEVDQGRAAGLIGKKIGEEFEGDVIGLVGYKLQITGGTDKDGIPMLPDVQGQVKKKVLLIGTPGFYPKIQGQRKRKTVRGNTISGDTVQINTKVLKKGEKTLEELAPKKEAKAEEKK